MQESAALADAGLASIRQRLSIDSKAGANQQNRVSPPKVSCKPLPRSRARPVSTEAIAKIMWPAYESRHSGAGY